MFWLGVGFFCLYYILWADIQRLKDSYNVMVDVIKDKEGTIEQLQRKLDVQRAGDHANEKREG